MRTNAFAWCLAAVIVAGSGSAALAAPLVSDPNAMSAWQGTQAFSASDVGATLQVDVEYAVYAPGAYGASGTDPSGGSDYVYAYQAFNDQGGTSPLSTLTVGLGTGSGAANIGSDPSSGTPGGTAPTVSAFSGAPPSSAGYYFWRNTIDPPAEYSEVLLFTSPNGPRWASAAVVDSGLSDSQPLPSPVPEPATLALLAAGAGLMGLRRRGR
ncbi:MAG: PEP-CTERM sorting domain-containing protein [Planctomycetota bacterium]|nr:PEP-CTERM sorting domain-containing protein [Planctomycetota bacterium]